MIEMISLPITPADSDSPIPLYHQIERDLRELIERGIIAPDELLPPETVLCRAYGVGRHTMRMALSRLTADGLIARKAGRGTVVRRRPDPNRFYLDRSFTRQIEEMGMTPRAQVLEISTGVVDASAPRAFAGRRGAPYCHIKRLRFADDEPIGVQSALVLTALCPGLERHDFTNDSLYDILRRHYNLFINEIHHTVTAVAATEDEAHLLHVEVGAPLLVVNTTAYVGDHVVIEHTVSHYRADRYEYSTTATLE